jgi:pimeloyl-ACP methyl ester carboxylesterase
LAGLQIATDGGSAARFDLSKPAFFGHSQGGLSGALYAAIAPALVAVVLSGTSGNLTTTVLVRKDPIDLKALAESQLFLNIEGQESLDEFHPALALMQTLGEVSDPMNYARYWLREPLGLAKNIYFTSGLEDPYAPAAGSEALAAQGAVAPLEPVLEAPPVFGLLGVDPAALPLTGGPFKVTAGFQQFAKQGHFPVFTEPARRQWREFFRTTFFAAAVTIPPQ